ncbi:MAG TPA: universal stress protein [Vicinamibacterales bacterium]|nr:universal stress protein [Vicinamibacterales bacterium]
MYKRILIAAENSPTDRAVIEHVQELARLTGAQLVIVHVADGWAARNYDQLDLRESEEMRADRAYLEGLRQELIGRGFEVDTRLGMGDPASEIARAAEEEHADLIALATHGHRFVKDVLLGATADRLRHLVDIPVLLVRSKKRKA